MVDRTIQTTKSRIVSLLTRIPQGVPRASLHCITGEIELVHEAMRQLVDDGIVTERMITSGRGKPRREYILTSNLIRLGLETHEIHPRDDAQALPGARAIVEYVIRNFPGTSRSELWDRAVVTKSWVTCALTELVNDGRIREVMEEDSSGGLIRRYYPAEDPADDASDPIRVAS